MDAQLENVRRVDDVARRHIVVIGAGIVGLSTALWLLRAGHSVTVVDREPPSERSSYQHACSYGNACTIALGACLPVAMPNTLRQVPKMLMDRNSPLSIYWRDLPVLVPWLLDFLRSSRKKEVDRLVSVLGSLLRLAEQGHTSLIKEAGVHDLVRRHGCLYLYRTAKEFEAAVPEIRLREREGVRMEMLSAEAIREREPQLAPLYHTGILFKDAYHLDTPSRYAVGLAEAIAKRGGKFIRGEAAFRRGEGAQVSVGEVELSSDYVVVAGGAWSGNLLEQIGDYARLGTERGYHVEFSSPERLLRSPTCYPSAGFYMVPLDNGIRAAGTVELGGLGLPARDVRTNVIERRARTFLPSLGTVRNKWLGFRPSMPDSLPVIGRSKTDPKVLYAFGHGHIGLTLAGITGRIICDLINGDPPPIDPSFFRSDRF